jgi:hypothetical protein
VVEVLKIY